MAVTSHASGSQLAVITTTYTLSTVTGAGIYEFKFDARNMANADKVDLLLEEELATGATVTDGIKQSMADAQIEDIRSISFSLSDDVDVQMVVKFTQTAGTGRTFYWEIVKLT